MAEELNWKAAAWPGRASDTLYLPASITARNYLYRCILTGRGTSTLTSDVNTSYYQTEPPVITCAIDGLDASESFRNDEFDYEAADTVYFVVDTENSETVYESFQWQYTSDGENWKDAAWPGWNSNTMKGVMNVSKLSYLYRCVLTDEKGDTYELDPVGVKDPSILMTAMVSPESLEDGMDPDQILSGSVDVKMGDTVVCMVAAKNAASYKWQSSTDGVTWSNMTITGNSKAQMSLTLNTADKMKRYYRCRISGRIGTEIYSDPIRINPINLEEVYVEETDDNSYLILTVNGMNIVSYQWEYARSVGAAYSKALWTGNNTSTIKIPRTLSNLDSYQFRCAVTGADGSVQYAEFLR